MAKGSCRCYCNSFPYHLRLFAVVFTVLSFLNFTSSTNTIEATNFATDVLFNSINFVYYCKPIHQGSTAAQWQRIDSGLYLTSTYDIDNIEVWIDNFDADVESIAMLGNDYTNSIFGIVTQTPGRIQINNFGSTPLSTSDWTDMIRLVAYRLVDVKLEVAGTCASYVGTYTRTINFQVNDINGGQSNIYTKTLQVESAAFIYTDVAKVISDQQAIAGVTVPSSDADIELDAANVN